MSATSPSSDQFGWASFYEEPEQYVKDKADADQRALHAERERRARLAVHTALGILRERGLLREDRLSYTRICELEHETEIVTGSWTDYLNALHEAELEDRKTRQ
jgi:hypothetical protein